MAQELLGAVTIGTVKHSRTVLGVGEDFHRYMEPGAFWQRAGISKTCYGSKTPFSELVFIPSNGRNTQILEYIDKSRGKNN